MLILLIILLTIMSIALQMSIVGLELSYQVGKRADAIRKVGEKAIVTTTNLATKPLNKSDTGAKVGKTVRGAVKSAKFGLDATTFVAKPVAKVAVKSTILASKATLKILRRVVSLIRDALCGLASVVIVVDIIVCIIILAIVGFYALYMM